MNASCTVQITEDRGLCLVGSGPVRVMEFGTDKWVDFGKRGLRKSHKMQSSSAETWYRDIAATETI